MVLVAMVADGAQVVVDALGALPANAEDRLLAAGVAHGALVFDASGSTVQNAQIVGSGAAVVGGSAVVPNYDNLLGGLEVPDSADVSFPAILLGLKSNH